MERFGELCGELWKDLVNYAVRCGKNLANYAVSCGRFGKLCGEL